MPDAVHLSTGLCVIGGGLAGVCGALAAARLGAPVVLVQDRSVLGGNASSEVRMHISGASRSGKRPGARESGLIEEIRLEDAVRNPHGSPSLFDLILYDMVVSEPNITLLLDTACTGCTVEETPDGRRFIREAHAIRTSTEEQFRIAARWFADCSGDGRLGFEAGAQFRFGREARSEYGEPLAPPEADNPVLGSSILLMARKHDRPMPFVAPSWARRFREEDLRLRSHLELDYGYWWAEWGGHLDTIRENPAIRHELLRIALGVWDHVKNGCARSRTAGAASYDKAALEGQEAFRAEDPAYWALEWVGALPGKRESRRFLGPRVLTQHDIEQGRLFEDQAAYGGWWIDIHPVMGVDAPDEAPCVHHPAPYLFTIPLQSLFSRNIANLFFAGRNISASHVAFAATRVMATCALMGQAVGTAAALALLRDAPDAAALAGPPLIPAIQQRLLRDDAFLIGVRNEDPLDLARRAAIRASSETAGGAAAQIVNGVTRATNPDLHPCLEERTNRWTSLELPAWIELVWPEPQLLREVQVTFDTGFERELTLSMSRAYMAKMVRGPQPETIRDYRLEFYPGPGAEEPAAVIRTVGNYQRLRRHVPDTPLAARRLRLVAESTHGAAQARVFEIRAYGK